MEIYLKISKLLLAHKTQNISAQETEELLAWRQEKTENEELFQKISQADGFEQFRQQYEEYDFTPKFLLLEQKTNKKNVKELSNVYPMLLSCFPSYLQYGKLSNFRIKELPQQNTHRLLQVVPKLF